MEVRFWKPIAQAVFLAVICLQTSWLIAQDVTIKREALALTDPKTLGIPLRTVPLKAVEIIAPTDGFVRLVPAKTGTKVLAQAEICRLDDTVPRLLLDKAKNNLTAVKIEAKLADAKGDMDQKELAGARLKAAEADVQIAQFQLDQLAVKAPFAGELLKVQVVSGQFVRGGEVVASLMDASVLQVEVPVDRSSLKVGTEYELNIEQAVVKAKVQAILPAQKSFEPLRTMVNQLSTAIVHVENPKGDYFAGQTVFIKLLPQLPFAPVPNAAIQNQEDGVRKVQILREDVVRDIPISELTSVGKERTYVSGAFMPGDEVVVNTSQPLTDGQRVKARLVANQVPAEGATPAEGAAPPAAVKKTDAGF